MTIEHNFTQDAGMTYRQAFQFAYQGFAYLVRLLEEELGPETFAPALEAAAAIGYEIFCRPDYVMRQGFSPNIHLERTRTLMQGDDCCDHRWLWDGEASASGEA
jgi:hypothetical protein